MRPLKRGRENEGRDPTGATSRGTAAPLLVLRRRNAPIAPKVRRGHFCGRARGRGQLTVSSGPREGQCVSVCEIGLLERGDTLRSCVVTKHLSTSGQVRSAATHPLANVELMPRVGFAVSSVDVGRGSAWNGSAVRHGSRGKMDRSSGWVGEPHRGDKPRRFGIKELLSQERMVRRSILQTGLAHPRNVRSALACSNEHTWWGSGRPDDRKRGGRKTDGGGGRKGGVLLGGGLRGVQMTGDGGSIRPRSQRR